MKTLILCFVMTAVLFTSCGEKKETKEEAKKESNEKVTAKNEVMTQELQQAKTPEKIIEVLKEGNAKFVKGDLTFTDYPKQILKTSTGQFPYAVVLSCLDSRVPVEKVFDLGIGDIFVARVAGNIVNPDILASMEYGCKVAGSKVIVVLGHSDCGAVKSAIDKVKLGNITELLEKIDPAIDSLSSYEGDKSSKNKVFVDKVTEENVELGINNIRKNSPILKEMEDNGEIEIVGAICNLSTGAVTFTK